jgi:hypothetical protein
VSDQLTSAASYLLAAVQNVADRATADEVFAAITDVLPPHLRAALDDAFDTMALA